MLTKCEPYFKFWRIFVLESWGESTVTIDYGRFYGREDGPDLIADAIGGFASDGFPSFNGWTATLSPDGTAYVGAEWKYPIAPRLFDMVANGTDCPKRFQLQCSNDGREWFDFDSVIDLPSDGTGGGGGDPVACPAFTLSNVLSQGADQTFINESCQYSNEGTLDSLNGCDLRIYYAELPCSDTAVLRVTVNSQVIVNAKAYVGQWPDLVLVDEQFDLFLFEGEIYEWAISHGNTFFTSYITIVLQGADDQQSTNLLPLARAVCS